MLVLIVGVLGVVAFSFFLQPYQRLRITTFIFPPSNTSYGATYNVQQALAALGSGGWVGKGYGHGTQTQLRFMKVRHNDFIFSVIGEELGLIGALFVLVLIGFHRIQVPASGAYGTRPIWIHDCLWGRHPYLLPGSREYCRQPEPDPGNRHSASLHQLWRQRADFPDAGDRIG